MIWLHRAHGEVNSVHLCGLPKDVLPLLQIIGYFGIFKCIVWNSGSIYMDSKMCSDATETFEHD